MYNLKYQGGIKMFFDDVKNRRSVRTFDGLGITDKLLEDLKEYAASVSNPYGIPVSFDFLDAKDNDLSSPVLKGEELYVTAKVKKVENADVAYGYSFESLLMHAVNKGLGTVWIGGTMPRDKFEKACNLADDEIMPCVSPIGFAADKMGVKEVLMRKGVKADFRYAFEELFFKNDFNTPLTEDEAEKMGIFSALEAVRLAPSAVNKQPWRVVVTDNAVHFYEKKDRGYDNGTYDLQKVDLGIAINHFDFECKDGGKTLSFKVSNPGIAMPGDNYEYIASFEF